MSSAHTESAIKRWASVPKKKRSEIARHAAKARMAALTPEDRTKIARKMVRARIKKRKIQAV